MKKSLFCVLLVLCMVAVLCPAAFADEATELTAQTQSYTVTFRVGELGDFTEEAISKFNLTKTVDDTTNEKIYTTTYIAGVGMTLPTKEYLTGENHEFFGWSKGDSQETKISTTETGDKTFYDCWVGKSYSLTLNTNGGTINSGNVKDYYRYGWLVTLPTDVTRGDDIFGGWYDNEECNGSAVKEIDGYSVSGAKTYYAKWTAKSVDPDPVPDPKPTTHTVTFIVQDGDFTSDAVARLGLTEVASTTDTKTYTTTYTVGVGMTLPTKEDLTRENYVFSGWSAGSATYTAISETDSGDKTFYASWEGESYSVTLGTNGGTLQSEKNVTGYYYGDLITLPTEITRAGYTFGGWYDNEACEGTAVTSITATDTGAKSYYAKWTEKSYMIEFSPNYETASSGKNIRSICWTAKVLDGVAAPTREGWTFTGWTYNDKPVTAETTLAEMFDHSEPNNDSMLNQAATLKAQWEQEKQPEPEQPEEPTVTPTPAPTAEPTASPQPTAKTNAVPKTGDDSRIGLALTLMALAALGLTLLAWRREEN